MLQIWSQKTKNTPKPTLGLKNVNMTQRRKSSSKNHLFKCSLIFLKSLIVISAFVFCFCFSRWATKHLFASLQQNLKLLLILLPNIRALQFTTIIKTLRAHYAVVLFEKDLTIVSTKTLAFLVLSKFKWFEENVKEWHIYKVARSLKIARIAPIEKRFKIIQARQMFLQPNNWHFLVPPLVSHFSCFLQIRSDILCLWM